MCRIKLGQLNHRLPLLTIILAAFATLAILAGCQDKKPTPPTPPAVTVANPVTEPVANYLDFTGNTAAIRSVTLVARVEGYLEQIHFTDGQRVKKGDVLFTIQQDQYKAQLKQAEAQLQIQKVALHHAETELARYVHLVKQDASTQTMVDHWQAQMETAQAAILAAQAQVELARLNLSYTQVKAPFDGRMGRHLTDIGSLVGGMGQQNSLAEINQIERLYVYFTIDERDLLRVMDRQKVVPSGTLNQQNVPMNFGLLTEDGFPHEGYLDFASISVTPTTGTLQVRGVFPNPDFAVLPGVFARVRVSALQKTDALLIPGEAVGFDQQGEYVLVLNAKNTVERRAVKTGRQVRDRLVISEGLGPTERVIVEGILQAVPGREARPSWAAAQAGQSR
ncbi:MAG: efflux RND transporter periplasmic adaptor subunit [Proteobacteria bacterium]|nr:efflux RND transporter periplasmic adaptor subunit [Pseudomonadota bacterium]